MTGYDTTSRVNKLIDTIDTVGSDSSIIVATVAKKCLKLYKCPKIDVRRVFDTCIS